MLSLPCLYIALVFVIFGTTIPTSFCMFTLVCTNLYNVDPEKALFMEVSEEQRQLAQQARAYGEQRQALTDGGGRKKQVVIYCQWNGVCIICSMFTVPKNFHICMFLLLTAC